LMKSPDHARGWHLPYILNPAVKMTPVQGYLAHKKLPPPQDHLRALGIVLLYGPRRKQFLMSEVPL